jgi:flavoprotein
MIFGVARALVAGAVRATVKSSLSLYAVPDDLTAAVATDRSERVNRAFKTIEGVRLPRRHDLEREIVIVPANFTPCHIIAP